MAKSDNVVKASDASVAALDPERVRLFQHQAGKSPSRDSQSLTTNQTLKASKALLAHIKKAASTKTASGKEDLLANPEAPAAETPIWLTLTTKRHIRDTTKLQPNKISLPHPINTDEESTICLIVADPQRYYKNQVASEAFPESLRKRITRVIDVSHLKKFKSFEAQRALAKEHDIFLGDDRIINRLPKALGVLFKTTAKRPIPVVLQAPAQKGPDGKRVVKPRGKKEKRDPAESANARPTEEIAAEITKAIGSALVHLSPSTNTAVKVGNASFTPDQIAENVDKVATELIKKFVPKQWDNVRSIYIKGPETAALPIWQTAELWADEGQVVEDERAPKMVLPGKKQTSKTAEKANIGKKRKSLDAEPEVEAETDAAPKRELRPKKKAKTLPEDNDDKLDKQISERKSMLKKQKSKARKALEA